MRYDSGLRVADNGERLAQLLEHLVGGWPVEVEDVGLVGHSSCGLVARSACAHALAWSAKARDVFSIGAPHRSGLVERAARAAERRREIPFAARTRYHFIGPAPGGAAVQITGGVGFARRRLLPRRGVALLRDSAVYECNACGDREPARSGDARAPLG